MFQMFYPVSCWLCPMDWTRWTVPGIFLSLELAILARFLGLYHSVCNGQWSRKNCNAQGRSNRLKFDTFGEVSKDFSFSLLVTLFWARWPVPGIFWHLENCHIGKVFLVYIIQTKCNGEVLEMINFTKHLLRVLIGGSFLLTLNQMFMGWSLDTWLQRVIDTRTRRDVFIIQFCSAWA